MPRPFKRNRKKTANNRAENRDKIRNLHSKRRDAKPKFKSGAFKMHQELIVTIESLSNQGDGVSKVDIPDKGLTNWVVFTPFTIPGESVRIRIINNSKNCSQAEALEIVKPSAQRRKAECQHFTLCGGCQYQHIGYEFQLKEKSSQIQQLLLHIAGTEAAVLPTIASPQEFHYRSKITPHFRKPYNGKISNIGFVSKARGNEYLDIEHCPIAMDEINQALPEVRQHTHQTATNYKKDHTLLLRAASGKVETEETATIKETVNGLDFHFLAGDFFQNNPFILPAFVDYAAKQSKGNKYLVDAYCGSGLFALSLASDFEAVKGVEISVTATEWATKNAALNQIDNAEFIAASAEAIFEDIRFPGDQTTVLIDPPRAGCSTEFLEQLFDFGPAKVVYVSCDPSTQMRDLRSFAEEGYQISEVQPFDLFPQTKHLECIVTLEMAK